MYGPFYKSLLTPRMCVCYAIATCSKLATLSFLRHEVMTSTAELWKRMWKDVTLSRLEIFNSNILQFLDLGFSFSTHIYYLPLHKTRKVSLTKLSVSPAM